MIESKFFPRDIVLGVTTQVFPERKGRRQTLFYPEPGRGRPGNWTRWKEVASVDQVERVQIFIVSRPGIAGNVIFGEMEYHDDGGAFRTANVVPMAPGIKIVMGPPPGRRIGRLVMRFKNNSSIMFGSPAGDVEVKVITAY